MYIVYEARLSDGTVYIGRTGQTLEARIKAHRCDSRSVIHFAFDLLEIQWTVLWEGESYGQSMSMEIVKILQAKKRGERLLNRTRGGWYDKYDCGLVKPNRGGKWKKGKRYGKKRKKALVRWLTPPSAGG